MTAPPYESFVAYYFSGTGNSLSAARWFAARAAAHGLAAAVRAIDGVRRPELPATDGPLLLGFHFPTHGFTTPWLMLRFVARFPRRRGRPVDVYLMNTRAGTKLGRLFFPGVSGTAALVPLLILLFKGYRVVGTKPLDMPSNWLQLHPGLTPRAAAAIAARCERQVGAFADRLLAGGRAFQGWWTLPLDLALAPVSVAYLMVGRFALAKFQVAAWTCDGCGLCALLCPAEALRMRGGRPYWTFDCEACMRCINICPKRAVETSHLYAVAVMYGVGVFFGWLVSRAPWWQAVKAVPVAGWLANLAAYTAVALPLIAATYWLLARAMRLRPVNKAFIYTSLTKYYRRYLAPGVKAADFKRPE